VCQSWCQELAPRARPTFWPGWTREGLERKAYRWTACLPHKLSIYPQSKPGALTDPKYVSIADEYDLVYLSESLSIP
jgi:hypothetical protein